MKCVVGLYVKKIYGINKNETLRCGDRTFGIFSVLLVLRCGNHSLGNFRIVSGGA